MPDQDEPTGQPDTPVGWWKLARGTSQTPSEARALWWRRGESYQRPEDSRHLHAEVIFCAMLTGAVHDARPDALGDRKFTNLTRELAKKTGLARTTVADLLNGNSWGKIDSWARVVVAAGADLHGVFDESLTQVEEDPAAMDRRKPTEQQKRNLRKGKPAHMPQDKQDQN